MPQQVSSCWFMFLFEQKSKFRKQWNVHFLLQLWRVRVRVNQKKYMLLLWFTRQLTSAFICPACKQSGMRVLRAHPTSSAMGRDRRDGGRADKVGCASGTRRQDRHAGVGQTFCACLLWGGTEGRGQGRWRRTSVHELHGLFLDGTSTCNSNSSDQPTLPVAISLSDDRKEYRSCTRLSAHTPHSYPNRYSTYIEMYPCHTGVNNYGDQLRV